MNEFLAALKAEYEKIKDVFDRWHSHVDPEQALKDAQLTFASATHDAVGDLHERVAKIEGLIDGKSETQG